MGAGHEDQQQGSASHAGSATGTQSAHHGKKDGGGQGHLNAAQKGNTEYVVLYIIVGILVLLYVPFSLKGRVKMIMKTNEVFSKPLHFEVDEKHINVSQGDEMAQLPWEQVYRFVANDKRILIFSNRKNAYILSKEQLGDSYEPLKELAGSTLEKYRLKIK